MSTNENFVKSNEVAVMFANDTDSFNDRQNFVKNLGELLKQTREGSHIAKFYLDELDIVHILYSNGYEITINVKYDSYAAIIKDVIRNFS